MRGGTEQSMEAKTYRKNQIIFRQGDFGDRMYDIQDGSVGIYLNYGAPEQKLLAELTAGKSFGEMALLDDTVRSATAVALENGTVLAEVAAADFAQYFESRPNKVVDIMQQLSGRLRQLTRDYLSACETVTQAAKAMEAGREYDPALAERVRRFASQAEAD